MKKHTIKYVGLDIHKDTIVIGIADEGRGDSVRVYGTIPNDINSLDKFLANRFHNVLNYGVFTKQGQPVSVFTTT